MNEIIKSNSDSEVAKHTAIIGSTQATIDNILDLNIKVVGDEGYDIAIKRDIENIRSDLTINEKNMLQGKQFISLENTHGGTKRYTDFAGIDDAYKILSTNTNAEIILLSFCPEEDFLNDTNRGVAKSFEFLMAHPNVQFLQLPFFAESIKSLKFTNRKADNYLKLADDVAKRHMSVIKHHLQGIKDLYNPSEDEKIRIQQTFYEVQEFFPGLNSIDKMIDFVSHIKLEIPEKMKGEKIEGVYCDIDGTIIDYVGIHSGKEGTQNIRPAVVKLLQQYESEGKSIFLRTGGDTQKKSKYLASLGITRPVLNKYDYAGATAEIVIDDTDQNTFILQSKILPETYIDTKDWD